ncbi:NAD(P)/FAD-dependent oxidoreductase [Pseudomonas guariconensis]|uniref:NAD(P)/FAD-dependent oxidoreductase n=1 Tax=Pseudomonas guariconensis TaxID=1288410 RepID=UPI0018AB7F89|nr:FAD-dependent oxidoreductase [Pseudomonas guariconensis]MBF8721775.1 FAD-dependent oxidoreductase [Pseudomonas guariconensis]
MPSILNPEEFDFVVIGAGPCGGAAAVELANISPDSKIALVGKEQYAPYERPPLSKSTLLKHAAEAQPVGMFGGIEGLNSHGISTFIPDAATSINRDQRIITLASGRALSYGKMLLATGSSPRRLDVKGADLDGVHYLRTFDDAKNIAAWIRPNSRLVIIGGGFIGLEVASTAQQLGSKVTVLEAGTRLLARCLPEFLSSRFTEKFLQEGVDVRLNTSVVSLSGSQRVSAVELSGGEKLVADLVIVGIGNFPDAKLALDAGLLQNDGVLTDATGLTSDPHIYAAGDVARTKQKLSSHPGYTKRLEAWEPALSQGASCARAMLGQPDSQITSPWIWSDQFDWNLQIAGHGELADEQIIRPGLKDNSFTVIQLHQGVLIGLITLNDSANMAVGRRMLQREIKVDVDLARNGSVRFKDIFTG